MTTTESRALEAMLAHHAHLADGVARRVAAVSSSAHTEGGSAIAAAGLVAFVAEEVLPHALAEELSIYRAAAENEKLAETVAEMVAEHRSLSASVERLATAGDAHAAATEAEAIGALFAAHVAKENELLLPPLAADDAVDLAGLLDQMHRLTEARKEETALAGDGRSDTESDLLVLLLDAADQLARVGEGDRACRMAAGAWAKLREPRPDLAARVTAALHRLARSVTAEPVTLSSEGTAPAPGRDHPLDVRPLDVRPLDVRPLAPARRHEQIFASYAALGPGDAFVLVNDHDPKPLRYQLDAEHAGEFTWEYLEEGPTVWRVRIGRAPGDRPG